MIDLYSNENFPMDMVLLLRNLGYDVLTSYQQTFVIREY